MKKIQFPYLEIKATIAFNSRLTLLYCMHYIALVIYSFNFKIIVPYNEMLFSDNK